MSSDSATDDPKPDDADVCVLWLGRRRGTFHGVGSSTISLPTKTVSRNPEISSASRFQPEFREIIQGDRADNLETLCANLIHCIIRGVPPGVIEINDVDRWNPNRIQRRMIVNHIPVQVAEIF